MAIIQEYYMLSTIASSCVPCFMLKVFFVLIDQPLRRQTVTSLLPNTNSAATCVSYTCFGNTNSVSGEVRLGEKSSYGKKDFTKHYRLYGIGHSSYACQGKCPAA